MLNNPHNIDDNILEEYEGTLHAESTESNNAKTHKNRLKALTQNDDID
jgi:hypothetical protein